MQARAQQEATGHELEEMQLSLSAAKQERDELRLMLSSSSSAPYKQTASPGQPKSEARIECCVYLETADRI